MRFTRWVYENTQAVLDGGDGKWSMGKCICWLLLGVAMYYWVVLRQDTPPNLTYFFTMALAFAGYGKGAAIYKDIKKTALEMEGEG